MHRRMSLGFVVLFFVLFMAGSGSAAAEPLSGKAAETKVSFDPLTWAWDWLVSLSVDNPLWSPEGETTEGERLNALDGGAFIDPNGNS